MQNVKDVQCLSHHECKEKFSFLQEVVFSSATQVKGSFALQLKNMKRSSSGVLLLKGEKWYKTQNREKFSHTGATFMLDVLDNNGKQNWNCKNILFVLKFRY